MAGGHRAGAVLVTLAVLAPLFGVGPAMAASATADVSITLSPDRTSLDVGDFVTVTNVLINDGPDVAEVTVTVTLLTGLELLSSSVDTGCGITGGSSAGFSYLCTLDPGDTRTARAVAVATASQPSYTMTATAALPGDPNLANNTATLELLKVCAPQLPATDADPGEYPDGCGGFVTIDDTAAPSLTLAPSSSPNAAGWSTTPIDLTARATENSSTPESFSVLSAIACTGGTNGSAAGLGTKVAALPITVRAQGASTVSCTATDNNGNTSPIVSTTVKLDSIAPILAPTISPAGALAQGTSASITPNASDGGSGIATATCAPVDTATAGTRTATCTATDVAGNTTTAQVAYTVSATPMPVTTTIETRAYFALWSTKLSSAQKRALRAQVAAIPDGATITAKAVGVVRAEGATRADRQRALRRARAVRAYLETLGVTGIEVSNKGRTNGTTAKARRVNITLTWFQ